MEITPFLILSAGLISIGLYGIMSKKNLLKLLISLDIMDVGVNLLIVTVGYLPGGTAPIMDGDYGKYVDPLPQALVLTAIVIGVSVLALGMILTIRHYRGTGSLEMDEGGVFGW